MPRARNIKPGFFLNEELVELPFSTRLLFIGLWIVADRAGRLEDKPKKIKMFVFPADDVDIDNGLNELQSSGFISRYEVDNVKYIQILAFSKHQNPHVKEVASTIPEQVLHGARTVLATLIPDSGFPLTDSLLLKPDVLIADERREMNSPPPKRIGTSLPDDWVLPKAWGEWAIENTTLDESIVRLEADKFRDHWHSNANKAGSRKADWFATWRNWVRNAKTLPAKAQKQSRMDISNIDYKKGVDDEGRF